MAKDWIKLNIGLLNDERFEQMSPETCAAWVTAYLLIAREGGSVKDDARLAYLFGKQRVPDAETAVVALRSAGWLVPHTKGGITIRGYERYQPIWRGESDSPEAIAARNAKRPTTREGRAAGGSRGSTVDRDARSTPGRKEGPPRVERGSTVDRQRRGEENIPRPPAREGGAAGGETKSLKEMLGSFEDIVPPKRGTS